ncbi:MAG TPA: MarR family transcriptional regulator [Spirochaetota bacterium]|nr:MarR family transcriptional regulator [Spirochaetota bacterium]
MNQKNRILYLISRSVSRLKYYSIKRFSDQGITISPSQMGILFFLNIKGEMNMSALSSSMGLDNSTLTRLVDKLVKAGFAERIPNPLDRRGFLVQITEPGRKEGGRAAAISQEINRKILEGFTESEIEIFIRVLESFLIKFNTEKGEL